MDMVTEIPVSSHNQQNSMHCGMNSFSERVCGFFIVLLAMSASEFAVAAEWDYSDSLLLSVAYTDNVELVENDTESEWALIVSPNFLINGKGRRLNVSIAAALQFVTPSDETFYPQLRANADAELVKDRFFLNVYASAYQQTIDPLRPAGSPINRTDNLTTTYTVGFNPYYIEHFGDVADLRADYSYSRQFYVSGDHSDRDTNDFFLSLNSGRRFSTFNWGVMGRYERTTYDDDSTRDTTFKSLDVRLGYRLTRSLSPYFTVGKEWNTYQSSGARRGGSKWLVGTVWTPNPRLNMDVGYGYRFFGHYPYVNLDQQSILAQEDLAGNPVDPFAGNPQDLANPEPGNYIGDGANVNKRLNLSYQLFGKRTTLGLNGRYSDRTYVESIRNLTEWIRGLGNHTNLTFSYTYSQRDSSRPDDDYTENRFALVLKTSLEKLAKRADLF